MHKLKYLTISIILVMSLSLAGPSFDVSAGPFAQTSPTLGAAGSYSVLAGQAVNNTGGTSTVGDVGVSPGSSITGFPPGTIGPPGTRQRTTANAASAQIANTAAFGFLDQGCDTTYAGVVDLTTVSPLIAGVYCADAFLLTGNLDLSGAGVWIFKSAATLTTSADSSVTGGDPCNVWWRLVSSADLGTNTSFIGNILALTSITLRTGASLNGRALAQTGSVTLDNNVISGAACLTRRGGGGGGGGGQGEKKSIGRLPNTGGAPIRNEDFPWSLVIVGGFSAIALVLGVRAYRRTHLPKQ